MLQEIKLRLVNLEFPFVRTYSIVTDFQVLASEKSVLLILIAASKSICGAIQLPDASCMTSQSSTQTVGTSRRGS